jgi:hypothetical protein
MSWLFHLRINLRFVLKFNTLPFGRLWYREPDAISNAVVYLGVDIAKSYLDAAIGAEKRRFSNDTMGHRQLIKWVKQLSATVQVICESSGGYERGLVRALVRARVKISLIQANRVRQFADSSSSNAVSFSSARTMNR